MTLKFSAKNGEGIQEESIDVDLQTVRPAITAYSVGGHRDDRP